MKKVLYQDLENYQKQLLNSAKNAMKFSYAPYSNFHVGAAVLTADKKIFLGTNIENSSYGATICAERVAIFKAVSEGYTNFHAIAIIGSSKKVITPCGCCRQVIVEFSQKQKRDIEIIMANEDLSEIVISSISELLPLAFKLEEVSRK
ncbi:MAG: cytidine deaminase [Candidatus Asgardarchaeia archaeon]